MTRAGDEKPVGLRIGGWLPPPTSDPDRVGATALIPMVREPVPDGAGQPVPPADRPPSRSHRRRQRRRWRTALLSATATVLAAGAVPLLLDRTADEPAPDRVAPPPLLVPDGREFDESSPDPQATTTGTPAGDVPTDPTPESTPESPRPSRSAPTTPTATRSARAEVPIKAPRPSPSVLSQEAEDPATEIDGRFIRVREEPTASGGAVITGIRNGTIRFTGIEVPTAGEYVLTLHYTTQRHRTALVTVNEHAYRLHFPRTGPSIGAVQFRARLVAGSNVVAFGNPRGQAPDLDRITIAPG
jgi:hypothetical protein